MPRARANDSRAADLCLFRRSIMPLTSKVRPSSNGIGSCSCWASRLVACSLGSLQITVGCGELGAATGGCPQGPRALENLALRFQPESSGRLGETVQIGRCSLVVIEGQRDKPENRKRLRGDRDVPGRLAQGQRLAGKIPGLYYVAPGGRGREPCSTALASWSAGGDRPGREPCGQFRARSDAELLEDVPDVGLHGVLRHEQRGGDFSVGLALRDQGGDAALGSGEPVHGHAWRSWRAPAGPYRPTVARPVFEDAEGSAE